MDDENGRARTGDSGSGEAIAARPASLATSQLEPETPGRGRSFSLAQMLVESGILPAGEVAKAEEAVRRDRESEHLSLLQVLVRDEVVPDRDLATLIALNLGLAMVDLRSHEINPEAMAQIPEEVARKYLVLPVSKKGDHLTVAMADPTDLQLLQNLASLTGCTIEPVITTEKDIKEHVQRQYRIAAQPRETQQPGTAQPVDGRVTARGLRDAAPAQIIELLLQQALQDRASDIHIEPPETRLRIRFRIDGILHEVMDLGMDKHPTMLSRLKIACGLNIAERRRPQDGQMTYPGEGEVSFPEDAKVDIRVAISGTVSRDGGFAAA